MARVKFLMMEETDPAIKDMFRKMEENGFPILNLFKVIAHSPKIGQCFIRMGNAILFRGEISPILRELAILRVGKLNQANYEVTQHVPIALQAGVTQEQIDALANWESSPKFDEQERAVLYYTDEVTQNIRVKDDTFAKLRGFLNEQKIVELTLTIGYYAMVCRLLEALQIELEK